MTGWQDGTTAAELTAPLPHSATERWLAIPPGRPTRLLVPARAPAAAAPALRSMLEHATPVRRAGVEVAAQALRLGGHRLLGRRPAWDDAASRLQALARRLADAPDAVGVIRLNPGRPNRKPVVQLLTPDLADTVAYVKIGWDGHTGALVAGEAETIATLDAPVGVRLPTLLGRTHAPLPAFATAPLDGPDVRPPSRDELARRAVALFPQDGPPAGLGESPLLRRVGAALADLDTAAAASLRDLHERVLDLDGSVTTPTSRWHGDLGPANVLVAGDELWMWDWERSSAGAPRGLDAAYTLLSGGQPVEASTETLGRLALVDAPHALVRTVLLVVALRHVDAAATGIPTDPSGPLDRLRAALA